MTDIARLQIRVQSLEAEIADRRLDKLAKSGNKAERATDGLTGTMFKFAGAAALAAGAVAGFTKLVSVTREFDVLNAQLITATGSAENAAIAFQAIEDFATKTPFDLAQATEAFTKLVNLGLTPSERAMMSYGDTASAMGKDLIQLVEAVADAATGEFERLKEFGIKSRRQGEDIAFTFRGMTTVVGNNAAEIEGFLIKLGENDFAGAMAQRMETLDGAISNLGDEWDKLFRNISDQGPGDLIEDSVRLAIDVLGELNAALASGETAALLDAFASQFDALGADIATTLDVIVGLWNEVFGTDSPGGIAFAATETVDFIIDAFRNMPVNIRTVVQLMAVELASLVDHGLAIGQAFAEVLGSEIAKLVLKAKAYGQALGQALNPFSDDTFNLEAELRNLDLIAQQMANDVFERTERQIAITREARRSSIIGIIDERETALSSFDAQITKATDLRAEYDKAIEARKALTGDRLEGFSLAAGDKGPTAAELKAIEKLKEARAKAFDGLVKSLRTEEEVIQESYNKRLTILLENTVEGSEKQIELKRRLDAEFAEDALGALAAPDTFDEQLEQLEEFYLARKDLILNNVALTEEQRTELEAELTEQRNERLQQLELQRTATIFENSAELFGSLSDLSKQFAGEQSGVFKAMFAISKAFAIADSIVKIQQGIANAAALPFPTNLGAMATVAASTVGIITTIQGTNFAGAKDAGGIIPQGKVGLVGEFGPELVEGPANVRSRRETAEMFKEGNGSKAEAAPAPVNNIRIINSIDPEVMGDFLGSAEGEELILNVIRSNPEIIRASGG